MGWRVGNDKMIKIWNDVWLSGLGKGSVLVQNIDNNYIMVVGLIDAEYATWKSKILWELFNGEQMSWILTIPIVGFEHGDERVWRGDNTRVYSTRSGYKWLFTGDVEIRDGEGVQQDMLLQSFYMKLWKLSIASKNKITI